MLERLFDLEGHGTSVRTEVLAGLITFLTMTYIAFVNPAILAAAGMDFGAVFVATGVAAAFGTLVMGVYANYAIALAPGMGLNAFLPTAWCLERAIAGRRPWPANTTTACRR